MDKMGLVRNLYNLTPDRSKPASLQADFLLPKNKTWFSDYLIRVHPFGENNNEILDSTLAWHIVRGTIRVK